MTGQQTDEVDLYLQHMTSAMETNSVVKVDFATFVSRLSERTRVFAYEGPSDKFAYFHWINRLKNGLAYEPYVAKNKWAVLQLFDLLMEDETGLGEGVYFFVDRDFDGLQGREKHDNIFITETYSIENQVVCEEVLEALLTIDFHCDGYQCVRTETLQLFEKVYEQFLSAIADVNFRIFVARSRNIRCDDLPNRVNSLVRVELSSVERADFALADLIKLEREPTDAEVAECKLLFSSLNPRLHHRGKFALLFFKAWLLKLRSDRSAATPSHFVKIPSPQFAITGDFSFETLATKAPPPVGLSTFLDRM